MDMDNFEDTAADQDEQHRIYLALNNAIPTPCKYRNLLIAMHCLAADLVRSEHSDPDEHAVEQPV